MTIEITNGRKGTWYENEVGKQFEIQDQANGYGDHKVIGDVGIVRYISKYDFKVI